MTKGSWYRTTRRRAASVCPSRHRSGSIPNAMLFSSPATQRKMNASLPEAKRGRWTTGCIRRTGIYSSISACMLPRTSIFVLMLSAARQQPSPAHDVSLTARMLSSDSSSMARGSRSVCFIFYHHIAYVLPPSSRANVPALCFPLASCKVLPTSNAHSSYAVAFGPQSIRNAPLTFFS